MPGSKVGPSGTAPQLSPRAARAPKSASAALRRRYSVLGRTEAGDEGFEVVRVGGRADHLGMIDILRRDEQLGVHLARLQAAGGQIGGELNQAKAEPKLEVGERVGRRGVEQLPDCGGAIVVRVKAVLVRRLQDCRQRVRAPGRRPLGDPQGRICRSS
jgi:hypothetical protein